MGHSLTSSLACETADSLALEKAALGGCARVIGVRRKAWNSNNLAYVVQGADGTRKDVVVTNASLPRRLGLTTKV